MTTYPQTIAERTAPSAAEQRADVAYCAAYVDAVHLGPSSAIDYMRSMEHDHRDQCEMLDRCAADLGTSHSMRYDAERRARHHGAVADAYADAIRVLDIAADAAHRAAERAS